MLKGICELSYINTLIKGTLRVLYRFIFTFFLYYNYLEGKKFNK
jgi:hypothetical protein